MGRRPGLTFNNIARRIAEYPRVGGARGTDVRRRMLGYSNMNAIRTFSLATAGAIALGAAGNASAASYLFTFEFDPLTIQFNHWAASQITFSSNTLTFTAADRLDYVSGDLNGATPAQARLRSISSGGGQTFLEFAFGSRITGAPAASVVDMAFYVPEPLSAGQTYTTTYAGRGIGGGGSFGVSYSYTPGRLTITQQAGAVPEPSAWALMIAGFGMAGAAMRRRATARVRFA